MPGRTNNKRSTPRKKTAPKPTTSTKTTGRSVQRRRAVVPKKPFKPPTAIALEKEKPRPVAGPSSAAVKQVTKAEHDWAAAIKRKDVLVLQKILGHEFTLRARGMETTREQWFDNLRLIETKDVELKESRINVYGDVLLVRPTLRWHAIFDEKTAAAMSFPVGEVDEDFHVTDLWVKRDERWQVVSRASAMVPQVRG